MITSRKFGRYGYTSYQRPRPLSPDAGLERPLSLGFPFDQPDGMIVAGGLGKTNRSERRLARELKKDVAATYLTSLENTRNKLDTVILQLTQGLISSSAAITAETPPVPPGMKLSSRMRKVRREIDALRKKHLPSALREAAMREESRRLEDDIRGRDNINVDNPPPPSDDTPPPAGGGDSPPPFSPGDGYTADPNVQNIYYQTPGVPDAPGPDPVIVQFDTANAGGAVNATELVEFAPEENAVEKGINWIVLAGSVGGSVLALWGVWELVKSKRK